MNKKAFSLVELIVVITILAILWLITFIALQGYSANVRDVKRISDVRSLFSKVNYEISLWANIEEFMTWATEAWITINWKPATSNIWIVNFENLRESQTSFQDPTSKEDYKFAYSAWVVTKDNWEREWYEFIEFATISEVNDTNVIVWNYYKYKPKDSPSLFKVWSWKYLVNWEDINWIEYTEEIQEPSWPTEPATCPAWQYLDWLICINVSNWYYSPDWDTNQYQCTW
jgi:prepilin-type N-terminal cleavage/methylation domain-containing protein